MFKTIRCMCQLECTSGVYSYNECVFVDLWSGLFILIPLYPLRYVQYISLFFSFLVFFFVRFKVLCLFSNFCLCLHFILECVFLLGVHFCSVISFLFSLVLTVSVKK